MSGFKIEVENKEFLNILDEKLNEITDEIFASSQEIIVEKGIIDEGTLLKSGNVNREFLEKTIIYGVPYADSIEFGRLPGERPPFEAILAWVKRKRLAKNDNDATRFALNIVKKIERDGTVPRPFLSLAIEKAANKLRSK